MHRVRSVQHLQRDDELAVLLARQVHVPKLAAPQRLAYVKVLQLPPPLCLRARPRRRRPHARLRTWQRASRRAGRRAGSACGPPRRTYRRAERSSWRGGAALRLAGPLGLVLGRLLQWRAHRAAAEAGPRRKLLATSGPVRGALPQRLVVARARRNVLLRGQVRSSMHVNRLGADPGVGAQRKIGRPHLGCFVHVRHCEAWAGPAANAGACRSTACCAARAARTAQAPAVLPCPFLKRPFGAGAASAAAKIVCSGFLERVWEQARSCCSQAREEDPGRSRRALAKLASADMAGSRCGAVRRSG